MSDGSAAVPGIRRYRSVNGFTLLELLVSVALFGIVLAIAMPHTGTNFALWGANQQLLADMRRTRADALTRGDHFRLEITSGTSYVERRMTLVGTTWVPVNPPIRGRNLPPGVSFTNGVGALFEFNTRGLLANSDAAGTLSMVDSHTHFTRTISVWPSGQVAPL